jgi:hypothetical protein
MRKVDTSPKESVGAPDQMTVSQQPTQQVRRVTTGCCTATPPPLSPLTGLTAGRKHLNK